MTQFEKSATSQGMQLKRWQDTIVAGFYWRQLMLYLLAGIDKRKPIPELYQLVAEYQRSNQLSLAPEQRGTALSLCRQTALVHCASQDHPDPRLGARELLRLDLAFAYNGHFVDGARTVIADEHGVHQLPRFRGIMARVAQGILPGTTTQEISQALLQELKDIDYYLLPIYGGHGIGRRLHQSPRIMPLQKEKEAKAVASGASLAVEFVAARQSSRIYRQKGESCHRTEEDISAIHEEDTLIVTPVGGIVITEALNESHWQALQSLHPDLINLRQIERKFISNFPISN